MMGLRDYQKEIIACVRKEWQHHRSVMVQMPTGTGKTYVLASIVRDELRSKASASILIVAHRVELIEQIKETVEKLGIRNDALKISSIQTVSRRLDALDFVPDLVIVDEAHHALAQTYRVLWEKWPDARFLGLTATPCRMNRMGFTGLFDVLVSSWSIAEFIEKGVLSEFDYVSIRPGSVEQRLIDSLEKRGADGDYQVKEMNQLLNRKPSIERLYRSMMVYAEGKKGIVYAINIGHAQRIAEFYASRGVKAAAIDSKTPSKERKRLVECFRTGELQVLVNVDVFSEGFDCPDVEFVQMARPTLSLAKYLQQVGRGLRKSEGKEACMLIDNVGLYRLFGLPVMRWDWEGMFQGEKQGKASIGMKQAATVACSCEAEQEADGDAGVELVISHELLLEKLKELNRMPDREEKKKELRGWQHPETGRWGLKKGRRVVAEAEYVRIFDVQEGRAAVRFGNYACGLVDDEGKVIWKRDSCASMKFIRNRLLEIQEADGTKSYVDLCNLQVYGGKPEVKRYGDYELLKVGYRCYSRTREVYVSEKDFAELTLIDRGFYLSILELNVGHFCLLAGDEERFYRVTRRMPDASMVITDRNGGCYLVAEGQEKRWLGQDVCYRELERLEKEITDRLKAEETENREWILEEYPYAMPYQSGMKWGLKVGNRITIPPVYRSVKPPVGRYCAVELYYSQWGVMAIDGRVLIEPKYPGIVIENNGMAVLTSVTGKKEYVKLE